MSQRHSGKTEMIGSPWLKQLQQVKAMKADKIRRNTELKSEKKLQGFIMHHQKSVAGKEQALKSIVDNVVDNMLAQGIPAHVVTAAVSEAIDETNFAGPDYAKLNALITPNVGHSIARRGNTLSRDANVLSQASNVLSQEGNVLSQRGNVLSQASQDAIVQQLVDLENSLNAAAAIKPFGPVPTSASFAPSSPSSSLFASSAPSSPSSPSSVVSATAIAPSVLQGLMHQRDVVQNRYDNALADAIAKRKQDQKSLDDNQASANFLRKQIKDKSSPSTEVADKAQIATLNGQATPLKKNIKNGYKIDNDAIDRLDREIDALDKSIAKETGTPTPTLYSGLGLRRYKKRTPKGGLFGYDISGNAKNAYNKVANVAKSVVYGREGLPPNVITFMNNYGDESITAMYVQRTPLSNLLMNVINVGSLFTFKKGIEKEPYDKLYHLRLNIRTAEGHNFILEKIDHINIMNDNTLDRKDLEQVAVPLHGALTLNIIMQKTQQQMGREKFIKYSSRDSNCQDFVSNVLSSSGLLTPELQAFIKQPVQNIINDRTSRMANVFTDLGASVDVLKQGGKRRVSRASPKGGIFTMPYNMISPEMRNQGTYHPTLNPLGTDLSQPISWKVVDTKPKVDKFGKPIFYDRFGKVLNFGSALSNRPVGNIAKSNAKRLTDLI